MTILICILLSLLIGDASGQSRTSELAGRSVEIAVVKADDLSPVAWSEGQIQLKQTSATMSLDSNLYIVLQGRGIAPDAEAFALVYDLNPTVRDINALASGASLQLPAIDDGRVLEKLLRDGDLVELTLDPEIRQRIKERAKALGLLLPSIGDKIADPSTQTKIKSLIGWYQEIDRRFNRRTAPPLRHATVVELQSEGDLLYAILAGALQKHRELSSDEQQQVAAIYEDIKIEISQFGQTLSSGAPAPQNFYSVTVKINGADSKLIESLRVYYTFGGYWPSSSQPPPSPDKNQGFPHLGSGTSENLLMKNYVVWASKDGDSNHPLTEPYRLKIQSISPATQTIDLSLTKGSH